MLQNILFKTEKKKHSKKDASRLKNIRNSSHNKCYKNDIEKSTKMKNEKYKKSLTTTMNLFTFFVYGKINFLLENIVWEHLVYAIAFLVKFFLVLQHI